MRVRVATIRTSLVEVQLVYRENQINSNHDRCYKEEKRSSGTPKSGTQKLFQTIQELRTTFEDSKLVELIANKQTVLNKI